MRSLFAALLLTLPVVAGNATASLADSLVYTQIPPDEVAFRTQIEKNWNVDLTALHQCGKVIELRVRLAPDGKVTAVDALNSDAVGSVCRQVQDSARRAVMMASPFKVPSGDYPPSIVFRFNPDSLD